MQTAEAASSVGPVPFAIACLAAAGLAVALAWVLLARRAEHRRIAAALGALGGDQRDPVRGARSAASRATQLDNALAELRAILETAPSGIVALDELDRIVTINPAAARMIGGSTRSGERPAEGRLVVELVRSPELEALIESARASGRRAEAEIPIASASGLHVAHCTAILLTRSAGAAQVLLVLEDRTELRRLEALRTEFVANVSHELRTPITSIRGYAETLADSFELPPDAARFARTIARSSARLGAIIEDLLLLSSLEDPSSLEGLSPAPVRVAAFAAEAVEQAAAAAREKRITIELRVDPQLWVNGNAGLLAHAVGNLVSNAVKYGPADSAVTVEGRLDRDAALVSVTDRGPGIPEVHRGRLFERFYRVDRARSRESGGTGLGLAIVKHVAVVHGGSVAVESRTDAEHGSTFRIRLPLAEPGNARNLPLTGAEPQPSQSRQSA
jgi:signal transduction histidine kinase